MTVAALVPLVLGLFPRLPVPSSVVEITAGILIGPAVLDWVSDDAVINVFATAAARPCGAGRRAP
jgi:Kef-type K+ transport system membrane component KefB